MFIDDLTQDITKYIFIYKNIKYVIDTYTILDTSEKNEILNRDTRLSGGTYISSQAVNLHLKQLDHLTDIANEVYNKILGKSKNIFIFQNDDGETYHGIIDQNEDIVTTVSIYLVNHNEKTGELIIII
jgi:hypothetical protein